MADDRLQIVLDDAALAATVSFESGAALEAGSIAAALDEAGIVHGIDEGVLAEMESRIGDENFGVSEKRIASATPPVPGTDGSLDLSFHLGLRAGIARADGSLDLLNRGLLQLVSSGDSLGFVRPPTMGEPGITVKGCEIPANPGKEVTIQRGDGVALGENGELTAARNGAIQYRSGAIDVLDHYEHTGNVDIRTGHVETNGSLSIGGSVNANFEVRAGGDVEIKGAVIGGTVMAEGSVQIMGSIAAGESGRICAGGDIRTKHAQVANLQSGGTVMAATDCVGSVVRARRLEVGRNLLGGEAVVESSITAQVAGSPSGAGTLLRVGEPYESESAANAVRSASDKTRRQIARRKDASLRGARADRGKQSRLGASLDRDEAKRHVERAAARAELLKLAFIDVTGTVNEGVQIRFGTRRLDIESTLSATRFRFDSESDCIVTEEIEK